MIRKSFVAIGISLALASTNALALGEPTQPVVIDFDGAGGANGEVSVGSLDWAVGSSLADDALIAGSGIQIDTFSTDADGLLTGSGDSCAAGADCSFSIYTHASLQGYQDPNGNPRSPTGINGTWEWTFVFGGTELVSDFQFDYDLEATTDINGTTYNVISLNSTTNFEFNDADIFFEIYYDDFTSGVQSDILTGTGFDDGKLILSSSQLAINGISGTFKATQFSFVDIDGNGLFTSGDLLLEPSLLDSFGGDNWADQPATGDITYTVVGEGATTLEAITDFQDTSFIKSALDTILSDLVFSTENVLPFLETNPSFCYDATAGTGGEQTCLQEGEIVFANLNNLTLADGTVLSASDFMNGADPYQVISTSECIINQANCPPDAPTGRDIIFQTDANQSFRTRDVPEPGVIALLGMGLGLMGVNGARRRRSSKA